MINLELFSTNFSFLEKMLKKRKISRDKLFFIKEKLVEKKKIVFDINNFRKKKNEIAKNKEEKFVEKGKKVRNIIKNKEEKLKNINFEINELIINIPNIPDEDTPSDEEGNIVIKEIIHNNKIKHKLIWEEILKKISLIDYESGNILSGRKFVVYRNFGSLLLHSLINFMREENSKRGYELIDVPYIVNNYNVYNTGQLQKFENDLYKIENSKLYLIPTSEVSLINIYQNKIINKKNLPIKLCAYSPCFRSEKASAGKENKSLIRLHQFHKVELIKISDSENSDNDLNEMISDAQNLLNKLNISYRIIRLCYKELGFSSAKTYDIEAWLPVSKKWLEISSCSNCRDFQSRRAKIKIKMENKNEYAHTLNGSALAIDRLILVLSEYYYNEKKNELILPNILNKYF